MYYTYTCIHAHIVLAYAWHWSSIVRLALSVPCMASILNSRSVLMMPRIASWYHTRDVIGAKGPREDDDI